MKESTKFNCNELLNRLKGSLNIVNDNELAEKFNLTAPAIYNWRRRNVVPIEKIIEECEKFNVDLNYIFYNRRFHYNDSISSKEYDELKDIVEILKKQLTEKDNQIKSLLEVLKNNKSCQ